MIVTCPSCQAQFRVPAGHEGRSGLRFQCTRCQSIFEVSPPASTDEPLDPPAGPAPAGRPATTRSALPGGFAVRGETSGSHAVVSAPGPRRTVKLPAPAAWQPQESLPPTPPRRPDAASWDEPAPAPASVRLPKPRGAELDSGANPGVTGTPIGVLGTKVGRQTVDSGAAVTAPPSRPTPPPPPPPPAPPAPPSAGSDDSELPPDVLAFASVAGAAPDTADDSFSAPDVPAPGAEGAFRVAGAIDEVEGLEVSDDVRNRIDPLVEFHDVFQDIRKRERADAVRKESPRPYLDPDLFSEDDEKAGKEPARETLPSAERFRTGRLDLKGGSLESSGSVSGEGPRFRERGMESDLVAAALAESGIAEPSPAELAKARRGEEIAALDLSGDAHLRGENYLGAARALGAVLTVVLTCVAALAFLAFRNEGRLDFRELDQMFGVAFRGQTYVGRPGEVASALQGADTLGSPVAVPAQLEIREQRGGVYEAATGTRFVVIDGLVAAVGDSPHRAVTVDVALETLDGQPVATRRVPIAARIEQPALESVTTASALDAAHEALFGRADGFTLEAGAEAAFSAAFLLDSATDGDPLAYRAVVTSAERNIGACWAPVVLESEGDVAPPTEVGGALDPSADPAAAATH